jgi:diguanylate cyclase (GGDEF)-like protein
MSAPTGSWSTQQLAEFLAVVATAADEDVAMRSAVELIAEALDADAVALVHANELVHSVGWPAGAAPVDAIRAAAVSTSGTRLLVPVPGMGELSVTAVDAGEHNHARLVVARSGNSLDAEEKGLLRAMARTLGLAVSNHEALRVLRERQRLLEGLSDIQRSIARRAPLHLVFDAIVTLAAEIVDDDQTTLILRDQDDPDSLLVVASTGIPEELFEQVRRTSVKEGVGGQAIREARLVVVNDYGRDSAAIGVLAQAGMSACMAAPVYDDDEVLGSISTASYRPGRTYSAVDQALLTTMAQQVSLALTDARIVSTMLHQALHDPLTSMPNRALFGDRLSHALQRAERSDAEVAVLFVDLDRFKPVNDSLGHAAGDQLLQVVGQRIGECLRGSDTAARLGGDEFAVLLEDRPSAGDAIDAAQRIIEALQDPVVLEGREVFIGASIGVATGRRGAEDLLRRADVAMYRAKADGKGRIVLYEASMQAQVLERLELEADLRHALARDELELVYQPIIELMSGATHGVEALVRWRHPKRGLVLPAAFIPVAEETGMIVEIGRWVLATACGQLAAWHAAGAPAGLTMNVNLSGRQLEDPELPAAVASAVEDLRAGSGRLVLEITETILMHDTDTTIARLRDLRSLGALLAVDDFGTGYSSLRYLSSFPVDLLKMARPFVDQIDHGAELGALAQTIVDLGANLGLRVIAEGIETAEQLEVLRTLGCELGQGFHLGVPVSAIEIGPSILHARAGLSTPAAKAS